MTADSCSLEVSSELKEEFPGLTAQLIPISRVIVKRRDRDLEEFKIQVYHRIRERWTLDSLKDRPMFRAYRDFFWALEVDPTKTRPASEALIRRVLHERDIPTINSVVDAYNLASMETGIPLAAFDKNQLEDRLQMRKAKSGETFRGIGMKQPLTLEGGEVVVEDSGSLVAIYPYRDAEHSKITLSTTDVLLMICGAPGISQKQLTQAREVAIEYITKFCNGRPSP
ncbi:MAG: B3/4 domain-containing protein [Thermoproteota archaeon]